MDSYQEICLSGRNFWLVVKHLRLRYPLPNDLPFPKILTFFLCVLMPLESDSEGLTPTSGRKHAGKPKPTSGDLVELLEKVDPYLLRKILLSQAQDHRGYMLGYLEGTHPSFNTLRYSHPIQNHCEKWIKNQKKEYTLLKVAQENGTRNFCALGVLLARITRENLAVAR